MYLNTAMGAVPLTDSSFYPDGKFDWYNPADWFRAGKAEAYATLVEGVNAAAQVEQAAASAAQDAANKAGSVTLKYAAGFAIVGIAAIIVLRKTKQ